MTLTYFVFLRTEQNHWSLDLCYSIIGTSEENFYTLYRNIDFAFDSLEK